MEENVFTYGDVFHELAQRTIVRFDVFQNLRIFDIFADSIDLQNRNISILARTLLLWPYHTVHCYIGNTLILPYLLHAIENVNYNASYTINKLLGD